MCLDRSQASEYDPITCARGDDCRFEHDIRKYLEQGKREDLLTFDASCPVFQACGKCIVGWRCRFVGSHSTERLTPDGRKELILVKDDQRLAAYGSQPAHDGLGVVNVVSNQIKADLRKKNIDTSKSERYADWLNNISGNDRGTNNGGDDGSDLNAKHENAARYVEPPFLPSEKRKLYYGPETPILAPLTTQGNLPFRRLAVELGAQITWSEMAMGLPLVQGERSEWALVKAHATELESPRFVPDLKPIVAGYDNTQDLRFGVQIAANKAWMALKATEVVTKLCPHIRAVDLNCGCPIDLVYRQGAGSALMDSPAKLEKMVRGMNAVSGEVPVQLKLRLGTKDSKPTADKMIERFLHGGAEAIEMKLGAAGAAAIALHGRSRQQRYTRLADWSYIADCAATVDRYNRDLASATDTSAQADERSFSNGGKMYFIGNGDCYSHVDYFDHIQKARVDSVMVARGALIKPWLFEEIEKGQYLDKTASERLQLVEKFARYGLETWGSDEVGIGTTRRFLLEWLSFACRYVPLGILEYLPPSINDRPPAFRGRNELETLLSSSNVKDWIKISEMFLGKAHEDFRFEPKHRSNSYENEAEG